MLIDSILIFVVMRRIWNWPAWLAIAIAVPLLLIDLAFLASNSLKIPDGGWFPLLIGGVVFTLLTTWKRGRVAADATASPRTRCRSTCSSRASRRRRRRACRAPRCS